MLEHNGASTVEICWYFADGHASCVAAWLAWLVTGGLVVVAWLLVFWKIWRWTR